MKCHFCGCYAPDNMDCVIDEGWVPSFWDGEDEVSDPVCGDCASERLANDDDGELVLRGLQSMTMDQY